MFEKIDHLFKGRAGWIAITLIFFFRLAYGLCSEFWFEDEMQIYLIGLKFYSTASLPLFGPDVVYTLTQIPGSLQGLLVGLPFYLWPAPEAPYILLNLLSTASLCLLAHYVMKRIPSLPLSLTYLWILTCPWVMNYSTHVLNPSYVLPAAILFFIGFMESLPRLSIGYLKPRLSFFLMGFALLWIFQIHLSWVLLIPFLLYALVVSLQTGFKNTVFVFLWFFAGALIPALALLPVVVELGWAGAFSQASNNMVLNWKNLGQFFTVLTRLLSLASFESARFLGANTHERIEFLKQYIWFSPFIVFAAIVGFIQPLWMVVASLLKKANPHLKVLRIIVAVTFLFTWLSFLFSVKGPSSHTFYLLFPLIMVFSMYSWERLLRFKWTKVLLIIFLFSGLVFNAVVMDFNFHHKSMYKDRCKVVKAIENKDYHYLGERRSFDRNP